jgi:group II intron reverse transcriptase/maturase
LFNLDLYLFAYGRIYSNKGAMTQGSTNETADGTSIEKFESIIHALRNERYKWTPVRRVYLEKKKSKKKRPLGLPSWSDKVLQEVIRLILEAYYEPQFSTHSHGFRPKRGCHTALREIQRKWTGTTWFIEGDIEKCFDSLNHKILLDTLRSKIQDNRFLRLIGNLLEAGYLEDWRYYVTLSGTPQGGIVSPLLANIYLNQLDKHIEDVLLQTYNYGIRRKENTEYRKIYNRTKYLERKGRHQEAQQLHKQMQQLPSYDPCDSNFRRLHYIRYADDFLLGFIGSKKDAEEIKEQIRKYLSTKLQLNLSDTKTLITHARTEAARFLGYEVTTLHNNRKHGKKGQRNINGIIGIHIPMEVIRDKCRLYKKRGKPMHRAERLHDSPYSIVAQYQSEYRGIVEYYRRALNLYQIDRLRWVMECSLVKTLAHKHRISVTKVFNRYKTTVQTNEGTRKVLQIKMEREGKKPLVAQWGGISLKRRADTILEDNPTVI